MRKIKQYIAPYIVLIVLLCFSSRALSNFLAQNASNTQDPTELIRVTGSRLRQIELESYSAMTVFTREDIERTGYATVADFLRHSVPTASMITENQTLSQIAGSSSFGGRDFTSSYTLVLLNGRRIPVNAIAASFVDLNLMPMAAVDRIEYLTDGASAIYGSDAVAGVLNIITRKYFEGLSVTARSGQSYARDGVELSYQVVGGSSSSRGNFLLALDFFKREPVLAKNRPLIRSNIAPDGTDNRSLTGLPGYIIREDNSIEAFPDCPSENIGILGHCLFDVASLYQAIPYSERQSVFTEFDYQLNPGVNFFAELRYSRAFTLNSNAAAPGSVILGPYSYFNPYPGEEIRVVRRYLDFGPRQTEITNDTFSTILGIRGDISAEHRWNFEIANHRLRNLQIGVNGHINSIEAFEAFNNDILNPFDWNGFDNAEKSAAFERINTKTFREGQSRLQSYALTIDGTTALLLPGGYLSYAAGMEYRKESFHDRSDNLSQEGSILGAASSAGQGSRSNEAIFMELALPVTSNFDLSTAARYDYINKNHEALTYKLGMVYSPLRFLKLRASYGTGFKAANMHSLFLGTSFGVQRAIDPLTCGSSTTSCEINVISGGNPELQAETSRSYNLGFIAQLTDKLSLRTDYWDIELANKVDSLSLQNILNSSERFPQLIHRDSQGRLNTDGSFVQTNLQNLTQEKSAGIEAHLSYAGTSPYGQIIGTLLLNKLLKSMSQESAIDPLCDFSSNQNGIDGIMTFAWSRGSWASAIALRHFGSRSSYLGGRIPGTCFYAQEDSKFTVKSSQELDFSLNYHLPFSTELSLGIHNLTNAAPAFDRNESWPWYNRERYSNMGRFFYITVSHEFQ